MKLKWELIWQDMSPKFNEYTDFILINRANKTFKYVEDLKENGFKDALPNFKIVEIDHKILKYQK